MNAKNKAEEKKIAQNIMQAFSKLPEEKRSYLVGYAEGVLAMYAAAKDHSSAGALELSDKRSSA